MLIFNFQFPISKSLCVAGTAALITFRFACPMGKHEADRNVILNIRPVPVERAATHTIFNQTPRVPRRIITSKQSAAETERRDGVTRSTDEQSSGSDSLQSPLRALFAAIRQEESYDGKVLVGDGGLSKGPYHISRAHWADGCEAGGVDWDYDTFINDPDRCEYVMYYYWKRHCPGALERGDLKTLARIHNGGPKGDRKAATLEYWRRIQGHMATEITEVQR